MIYPFRDYVDAGGLMSYRPDLGELAQRLAVNVQQILNGAKPGDIQIYRPNKFQLLVNLKAAKALASKCPRRSSPAPTRLLNDFRCWQIVLKKSLFADD